MMSKLTAMLKWAMRIGAVGGTLLAMAVGTAAWMHRTQGREWLFATPATFSDITISTRNVEVESWLRSELESDEWKFGRYGWRSSNFDGSAQVEPDFQHSDFHKRWHDFGIVRGDTWWPRPSYIAVLCPTWSVIAVLLLPMGLWAGIGWRQRRRVKPGHCANCGYDLRATPDKCPECGSTPSM